MAGGYLGRELREFFKTEGRELLYDAITARPGDKLDAQIASATAVFDDLSVDSLTKVHQGRCGERMFLRLYRASRAYWKKMKDEASPAKVVARLDRQDARSEDIAERLDRLEQKIDALYDALAALPGDPADLAGRRERNPRRAARRSRQMVSRPRAVACR